MYIETIIWRYDLKEAAVLLKPVGRSKASHRDERTGLTVDMMLCARNILAGYVDEGTRLTQPQLVRKASVNKDGSICFLWYMTTSLEFAVWMQFANELENDTPYDECQSCGHWFPVTQGGYRSDRAYCSDACRMKTYRARKKQAKQMRADGTALRTIAKELGSDLETVKGWVSDVKKPRRAKRSKT